MSTENLPVTLQHAEEFAKSQPDIAAGLARVVAAGIAVYLSCERTKNGSGRLSVQNTIINSEAFYRIGVGQPDRAFTRGMEP